MRLFAKLFLYITLVLSMALSLSGYLLITSSYKNAVNRENELALDKYQYNKFSVQASLIANEESLQEAFSFDYGSKAAFFAEDKSLIFSNLPADAKFEILNMVSDGKIVYKPEKIGSKQYIMVCGKVVQKGKTFFLVVASDITSIILQKKEMIQSFTRVYFLTFGISMLLILVLSTLITRPIKNLTKASAWIAEGHYSNRLSASGGDEIAELSRSFNTMAKAIEDKIDQLFANAQQKEEFVANFAHEIKTPLTSVIGYADMIYQKDLPRDDVKKAAGYILDEGMRLEALSLKLMDLIVLNRQEFVLEEMPINEVLENVAQTLVPLLEEKKVDLELKADRAYVRLEYDLFKTLLINLIDNSVKAGCTKINIFGRRYGNRYSISVSDNGCGIPAHELERVTEAFYMVDKSRSRKQHGAGLGLALASKIAQIHSTELKFTSEEQKGTTVEINLYCEGEETDE